MQHEARSITLGVARIGAVLFALGVLSYLVVTAQRRAAAAQAAIEGPPAPVAADEQAASPQSAPEESGGAAADAVSATQGDAEIFLFGSKSVPLEAPAGTPSDLFLSTSKSAVIDLTPPTAGAATTPKPEPTTFLPSSKFKTLAPLPASPAKPTQPVFLPSSKSQKLEPVPAPAAKPTTPAQTID